ncbi:MAG: hypothetical protein QOE89_3737 [Pseudonocardiales bacterium]|nr:hypothetical protein [Pseudonocardiales bacterium]
MGRPDEGRTRSERGGLPAVRWGLLGTANIAAKAFLPALRETGGRAVAVGSRSVDRAAAWAADNQVERADSYGAVISDEEIDAVYLALPNDQHAHWAAAAISAGKAALCEKPLAMDAVQAADLLAGIAPDALLWESFVFPFHPQTDLIRALVSEGRIGSLREIISEFHFSIGRPDNIRLQPERGGGALYDVGCYPIRLARLLSGAEPVGATGSMGFGDQPVDLDVAAVVDFPDDLRLMLSAGMRRSPSTFTRIIGTQGELRVSNPFHPIETSTVELWVLGDWVQTWPAADGTAFRHALEHIRAVLTSGEAPRYRATEDGLPQARAMDLVRAGVERTHPA